MKFAVVELLRSVQLFCNSIDCSLPGSSVHRIFQARILEWVAVSFSRGSSQPRDRTLVSHVSCIGRWDLYHCVTWEALYYSIISEFQVREGQKMLADWSSSTEHSGSLAQWPVLSFSWPKLYLIDTSGFKKAGRCSLSAAQLPAH